MRGAPILLAAALGASALAAAASGPPPLTIEGAKAEALRNHPAYAAAQLRAVLARESQKEAQAAYFPTATAFADAVGTGWDNTRILAGGINNPSVYDRLAEGLSVTQLITDFGRTQNLARGAKSEVKAADAGSEASREQVLLNAEANYLATLQTEAVLRVARETLDSRKLLSEQVSTLARNQLKSELDVSFAKVAVEQAELLVQKAQGDVDGSMASLGAALGRRDAEDFSLEDDHRQAAPVPELSTLVASALGQRPDLLSLRYQRDAAASVAASARDANYPTLSAMAVAGNTYAADSHLPDKYAAAGVQLTVPLFEGGALVARQHEAEIRARVADESLREAENNAVRDVRLAHAAASTAYRRLSTTRELLKHATEALELAEARYRAGSASIVELSEAQLNQASAAIALANAEYDTRIQEAVLDYAAGTLR
jgi:outer membrane protein